MEIRLENITLREYQMLDWKRVHIYASVEEFSQYDAWGPNTESDSINFVEEMIKSQNEAPRKDYNYAIIDNNEKLLIGGCSLRMEGPTSYIAMIGYAVNPKYQGRGVATDATRALLRIAFEKLNLSVVYATCDIENTSSYKVMEKCGLKRVGEYKAKRTFKGRVSDEFRYEMNKEDYAKLS